MATKNPFVNDSVKGPVWEEGYIAGFNQPDQVPFLPLSPELLDVYVIGANEGRNDKLLPLDNGQTWCPASLLPDMAPSEPGFEPSEGFEELKEHLFVHALIEGLERVTGQAVLGLVGLVAMVINIHDTPLHPLPEDFNQPLNQEGEDTIYLVICPRKDHPMLMAGNLPDGQWVGTIRNNFLDAVADQKKHGHAESFIVRTSVSEGTVGPVWVVK